jgi:glutamate racemase
MNNKAIGVFDSGIGGLTVYQALKKRLPQENIVYLGDTARLPYGSKSAQTIIRFSMENAVFLMEKQVKIIVVACNSASSYAVTHLQQSIEIPVIGVIEPGAEAVAKLNVRRIGVIGTTATIESNAYKNSILDKKPDAQIISQACPLFVPLVEEGWINHPATDLIIKEYLLPLKNKNIGALVLGCTHYPVLNPAIGRILGSEICLIDSAKTTADKVFSILSSLGWLNQPDHTGIDTFYVTDFPERFKKVGEIFLKRSIDEVICI